MAAPSVEDFGGSECNMLVQGACIELLCSDCNKYSYCCACGKWWTDSHADKNHKHRMAGWKRETLHNRCNWIIDYLSWLQTNVSADWQVVNAVMVPPASKSSSRRAKGRHVM